ncbi:MAG: YceI family protein [Bacteroidetes bacterium]|jgi:polyisoprenoid-binding protein YceI|nr:YceI family protein [Bacteroidota bacterium]
MPDPPRFVSAACGLLLLALACAGSFLPRAAQAQVYQTRSGYAEFTSDLPLHSFRGTSEHLVGRVDLSDGTVDFYLDLATLDTGIGKRDKDLRRTLDTDEYPFAEFFGQIVSDYDPTSRELQPVRVRGDFTIHGVTREITVEGSIQRTPTSLKVLAGWTLNLEDYDIEPPSLVIVKVDPEQDIFIDAVLEPLDDSNGD